MSKFKNYKINLQNAMKEVCLNHGLFPNSLQYRKSSSKTMPGYRIQIFEENYPSPPNISHEDRKGVYDSYSIALIKEVLDKNDEHYGMLLITVRKDMQSYYDMPNEAELTLAPQGYFSFYINPDSTQLIPSLKRIMEIRIRDYRSSKTNFGCCSSFNKCSDAKKCVHYNLLYSTCCIYRIQHLDKGHIFYGKNKNIQL